MSPIPFHAPVKEMVVPKNIRLAKKLKAVEDLPPEDQRTVIDFIDALRARQEVRKTKKGK